MIMGIWKDLAAYVLLAHLVTLSRGSYEGKIALEEILAKNGSIVVIEDKADGAMDLGKLLNVESLPSRNNNSSVPSKKSMVVDEKELVAELEEALVSAASSGQVIMIAPPVNKENSTKELPGPVIVIETPVNKSKSLAKDKPSHKNKRRKAKSLNFDQDIAQSQTRQTVGPKKVYADDEDLETLGDLLAITEYEPQRIDGKGINGKIPEAARGKSNSTLQSSNILRPEDTHYDVPRQKIQPRNHQRISDNLKNVVNGVSRKVPIQAASSNLRPIQTNRRTTTSNPLQHQVETRKPNTNLDHKPTLSYTEIPRGPTHSEMIIPLTTKPTVARKSTYNEIARNNLLGAPSSIDTTSTFVPGLSENTKAYSRSAQNLTSTANQSRKNFYSTRVPTTSVPLPSTHYSFLQHQALSGNAKTSSQPTLMTSAVPRASRRIDDYPSPDYVTKSIEELQSLTNQPLGYLTRYNLPSLVPRRIPKTRLHPAASEYIQTETPKKIPEEGENYEERSSEGTTPRSTGTVIPLHGLYQSTRERLSRTQTTSRPPLIDYQRVYQNDNQQPVVDYRKAHQSENERAIADYLTSTPRFISLYQERNQRPVPDYRKAHQKVNQETITDKRNSRWSPIAETTATYDSYDEYEAQSLATPKSDELRSSEATSLQAQNEIYPRKTNFLVASTTTPADDSYEVEEEQSLATPKSEELHSTEATNPQARNEIYTRKRNFLVASTTTPAYDSYEDERTEKSKLQLQRFAPNGRQRQRATTNSYVTPKQVHQPYNYPRTAQPVTSTSLLDNPIYKLHGVKTTQGIVAANAIHNPSQKHQERSPSTSTTPLRRHNSRYVPYETSTSQRIVTTTAASASYEDSEETTSSPVTTQRLRNSNYVGHHDGEPFVNSYKKDQKSEVTPLAPTRNPFTDHSYKKPINNQYSLYQTKPISQSTSRASLNPQRNYAAAEVTASTYVGNDGSNENESNDRSYVPSATKLQTSNHPNKLQRQNLAIRTTEPPEYESYEDGNEQDRLSPNRNAKLIESNTANYGNRVRPRVVPEQKRHFLPSYNHAALTTPGHRRDVESNYGGRRRASVHVEDEPVESVHRADVEAGPYEDEVPASSGYAEDQATHQTHAKAKKHGGGGGGGGDHKHEEGGGMKHEEDHHESHGEKGDKGYKGYHEYDKGSKGHHDKEDHNKEYDEKKGEKKKYEDEGGYHKKHHHGEKGNKEAEFAEKGEHQKGHSTKGQHVVHKKDEYEKKTEFYDESHEEDGDEKEGEYHHEHEHKKGGHEKKGHHDSAHHEDKYGKKGEHEKGHHYHEKKGHDGKDGKDQYHHHHEKYGKKGGHEEGLKWSHKKGDDGHGEEKGS